MGLTVYGGGGKPEEEKTVTAGTSAMVVNPSSGKVMKKVTVNPTPTESKSVAPTTSELTVTPSEGKHLSQVVVGAVEDVTPEVTAQTPVITQIAENLGVTITTPSGTNKHILQGNNSNLLNIKNNAKKEGLYVWKKLTAQDSDLLDFVVSDSETAYPDGAVHTDGYWYTKFDPTTLLAKNIRKGISIWGVLGTMITGMAPEDIGYTKIVVDKIICSADTTLYNGVNHSLGDVPEMALLYTKKTGLITRTNTDCILSAYINKPTDGRLKGGAVSVYNSTQGGRATQKGTVITGSATDTKISITNNSPLFLKKGIEYILITMA